MGRSGGGGGGGHGGFSGGGFGGGFSGGHSGSGGRSSSHSHSSSSHSGGYSHSSGFGGLGPIIIFGGGHHVNPHHTHYSGSSHSGSYQNSSAPSSQGGGQSQSNQAPVKRGPGCGTVILVCLIFFFLMTILGSMTGNTSNSSSITPSTYDREKLPSSAVTLTDWYKDADGDWIHNSYTLEKGLKDFYEDTGVQPYVYILPNGRTESSDELASFAEQQYDQLFRDEGHFLLVFCDNGYGGFNCGYWVGSQASTVMDSEAIEILSNYLDYYYSDMDIREEEIFSLAFSKTGDRIMTVTKSDTPKVMIAFLIVIALLIVYRIIRKKQQAEKEKAEQTEQILNTPLQTYADAEVEALAGKYDQNKPAGAQAAPQASSAAQAAPAPQAPAAPAQEVSQAVPVQQVPAPQQVPQAAPAPEAPQAAPAPVAAEAAPAPQAAGPADPNADLGRDDFKDPELEALEAKYQNKPDSAEQN